MRATIGKAALVCGIACLGFVVLRAFGARDRLGVSASLSPSRDKLFVTLSNGSHGDVRIVGNEGACGKGGCILPIGIDKLGESPTIRTGEERTFVFSTRGTFAENESCCSVLIHVDDGGRLRRFQVWIRGFRGHLATHINELSPESEAVSRSDVAG